MWNESVEIQMVEYQPESIMQRPAAATIGVDAFLSVTAI
jgi:hypothetical protein